MARGGAQQKLFVFHGVKSSSICSVSTNNVNTLTKYSPLAENWQALENGTDMLMEGGRATVAEWSGPFTGHLEREKHQENQTTVLFQ